MKKSIMAMFVFFIFVVNSFANDDDLFFKGTCVFISDSGYMWIKPESNINDFYIGGVANRWDTFNIFTENSMVLDSNKNIVLKLEDTKESQTVISIPTKPNGDKKIKCSLWFNPITQTLKATPINKITCGGIE